MRIMHVNKHDRDGWSPEMTQWSDSESPYYLKFKFSAHQKAEDESGSSALKLFKFQPRSVLFHRGVLFVYTKSKSINYPPFSSQNLLWPACLNLHRHSNIDNFFHLSTFKCQQYQCKLPVVYKMAGLLSAANYFLNSQITRYTPLERTS